MKPARQHVQQQASDELVGGERHDARPLPAASVVLVAEGDAGFVEGEQPAVGDGDAVGVARQVVNRLRTFPPDRRARGTPLKVLLGERASRSDRKSLMQRRAR